MTETKKSIVFCHGLWADGSCFSKLIPTLQAEGHEVIAAQNSLDSLKGDVAAIHRALGRVGSPLFSSVIPTTELSSQPREWTNALPRWSTSARSRRMPTRRRKASKRNFRV